MNFLALPLFLLCAAAPQEAAPDGCSLADKYRLPAMPMDLKVAGPPMRPDGRATGSVPGPPPRKDSPLTFIPRAPVESFEPTPNFAHLGLERRFHPPAPDSLLATELELANGSTWVFAWSSELAGEEDSLGLALKTLSKSKDHRLVVRVEAEDPLLECERVRFALGRTESLAEWVLAYPSASDSHLAAGPSTEGIFTPGHVCAVVWQQGDPRPRVTANSIDQDWSGEVRTYNRAVERYNTGGPDAPTPEELLGLQRSAFRSMLFEIELYSDIDWREKGSALRNWSKRMELESDLAPEDAWLQPFAEYQVEGLETALEALEDIADDRGKAYKKRESSKEGSAARSKWAREYTQLNRLHSQLWFSVHNQARLDLTRAYALADSGRLAPLRARWAEINALFEWTFEEDISYPGIVEASLMLDAKGNIVPYLFEEAFTQRSLDQEDAFAEVRAQVRFNPKKLSDQRQKLIQIELMCPNSPTADRCRAWLELLENQE